MTCIICGSPIGYLCSIREIGIGVCEIHAGETIGEYTPVTEVQ